MSLGKFWRTAEDIIKDAIENGEFDNLPGKGKPLKMEDLTPGMDAQSSLIRRMLEQGETAPEELQMLREVRRLRRILRNGGVDAESDRRRIEAEIEVLERALEARASARK